MQITTKDLHYLTDELSWELLAMKKCFHFSQECQDADVKNVLTQIGQMHKKHYETLLEQLQSASGNNQNSNQPNQ